MNETSSPLIHPASCVAIAGRGILIEGEPGSGKSSLALALIDRGAHFVCDDGVLLNNGAGRLIARPHPNTRGLLEVRNLGILTLPALDSVVVALRIRLDRQAPRFIERAETSQLANMPLPLVRLWPDGGPLAIKAELALAHYGIQQA